MTITSPQSTSKAWAKAIAKPAKEFALTPLSVLAGQIPEGLRGTLYRNGPARLERGGQLVGHWFDGDGAILAVHFREGAASGVYRYVKTAGYLAESEADKFLYSNYGMTEPGPIWKFWFRAMTNNIPIKNTANTSVLALPDQLLALWEGGNPHALDLESLETKGIEDLGGLTTNQPYSAHPQVDPQTGEIFSFGISMGAGTHQLSIYRSDRTGKIVQKSAITLDGISIVHSCVMAGPYLIFFIPPLRLNVLPVLMGSRSYSDAFEWQAQKGTQVLVVDRNTLELVSRGETDPWFHWHFGNGYVDADGLVVLDLVKFADFAHTNDYLREVATGETHTVAHGTLCQIKLDPKTAQVKSLQQVVDRACEFPVVPPQQVGQPWRHTYLAVQRHGNELGREWFGAIARFDYETATLTEADLGANRYPVEPIYVTDSLNPQQGWVLTVVYDGNTDTSEVWIFDSDRLNQEPVCRLGLPEVIPIGFHGTWKAAS